MFEEWDIDLFRSVELSLVSLFIIGSVVIVVIVFVLQSILQINEWVAIGFVVFLLSIWLGKLFAKIAIKPLHEHFDHLDRFSKETLHELNLPVSTIATNVALLRKTHTDDKSQKRLERIEQAALMLKNRYDELDYFIQKQMEKEAIETFDVAALVQERVEFLTPLYSNIKWEILTGELLVHADRIGLSKVIDNLIDNGVKYSTQAPQIALKIENRVLSICDQGCGMDEAALVKIFDHYYQSDKNMAGYGIGLGLVKRYCDKHDIKLRVESKLGIGACIKLTFRL
jgi:two-component system, OmpR family, sensor kinase